MLLALLAACSGGNFRPVSDTPVRIGAPYNVRGTRFVPAPDPNYDMLGYADSAPITSLHVQCDDQTFDQRIAIGFERMARILLGARQDLLANQ